jgi:hypothetical protein
MGEFFTELNRKLVEVGVIRPGGGPPIERIGIEGYVHYKLMDEAGRVKQEGGFHNLVTSIGDMWVAQYLASSIVGDTRSMYAELGVNTTAPAKADTGLGTLINASSQAISAAYPTRVDSFGTGAGEWTVWRFLWAAGAATNGSIGEIGMRTQVSSFIAHALVAPNVPKTANDTLQVDWGWKTTGA